MFGSGVRVVGLGRGRIEIDAVVDVDVVEGAVDGIFEREGEEGVGGCGGRSGEDGCGGADGAGGGEVVLGEVDAEGFFVGVVFPGDGDMWVAGVVEPLMEEDAEIAAADGFHDLFEIGAGSVFVAVGGIVGGDAIQKVSERKRSRIPKMAVLCV